MKKSVLACFFAVLILGSPQPNTADQIKIKDLPERHRRWLSEEVFYIITPVEKDVFLELGNEKERDIFIKAFWQHRDPTPGTEQNEFRDEHYRRFEFANRRFRGAGKPGWKTDRGKVYILLGEPRTQREFQSSDAYYPVVKWDYQGIQSYGLPQAFHLLFYRKGRIGDYILYNPGMDFPSSLLSNYQGDPSDFMQAFHQLDEIEPMLASASLSLIPGESVVQFPSLASAALVQNIDVYAIKKVEDRYARKFIDYKDSVELEYTANYIDSSAVVHILQDYSGISYVHLCIEPQSLSMGEHENTIYSNLEFNGILTDEQDRTVFQFEKSVPLSFTRDQYQTMRTRPFDFYEVFPVIPGNYRLSVLFKNTVSKEFSSFETSLAIPDTIQPNQLSSLLLGFNSQKTSAAVTQPGPFKIEGAQFYIQPGNTFLRQDNLHVLFQIMSPENSLRESGSLKYTFIKDGQEPVSKIHPVSKYPESINFTEVFPLQEFSPGYYRLKVSLLDGNSTEVISSEEEFVITPVASIPRPWVYSRSLLDAGEPEVHYLLGRQLLNLQDFEKARIWLEKAYRRNPEQADYAIYLARTDFHLTEYQSTLDILGPILEREPDSFEAYYLAGRAHQELGQYDSAIDFLNRAIDKFGIQTGLLNTIGECYISAGNIPAALVALERSLEIDPDQPSIKQRVESIK